MSVSLLKGAPVLVLCGPSGSGKSTLLKQLLIEFKSEFGFSTSHTTRSPRPGEMNGKDYHFVSQEVFDQALANKQFIENAVFSGNSYATSWSSVCSVTNSGRICILDIDVEGVKQLKKIPDFRPRLVFVSPPNLESLKERLEKRGTETEESIAKRLAAAQKEMEYGTVSNFDVVIVNDVVEEAYLKLKSFILPDINNLVKVKGAGDQ